jgi:hypothetical protein
MTIPSLKFSLVPIGAVALLFTGCQSPNSQTAVAPATIKALQKSKVQESAPRFDFPWKGLEDYMAAQPGKKLMLIGYGSLLSKESAAETIKDAGNQQFPAVVASGAKRIFNYVIPPKVLAELGTHAPSREGAALNVVATGNPNDLVTGRLIEVGKEDLPGLKTREYGYHLRPVACVPWNDPKAKPFVAYVLAAEDPIVNGKRVVDNSLLPNRAYVEICLTGAREVSPQFADAFLDTSYLGDGRTSLRKWLREGAR